MRHSFATWARESGVQASYLAVVMDTSIREFEDTHFRWLRRTDDQLRAVFDAYDARLRTGELRPPRPRFELPTRPRTD
jgi:hypothetical protein